MEKKKAIDWGRYWKNQRAGFLKDSLERVLETSGFNSLITEGSLKRSKRLLAENGAENRVIVEVGSGTGKLALGLRGLLGESRVVLLDIAYGVLETVSAENVELINADVLQLPLKSNCCDLSCNVGTIEHFTNPVPVIREMKRISREHILCAVPAPSIIWKAATFARKGVENDASLWVENTRYYSESQLKGFFQMADIRNIHTLQQRFLGLPFMNIVYGTKE